jgi:hypothetical protein
VQLNQTDDETDIEKAMIDIEPTLPKVDIQPPAVFG